MIQDTFLRSGRLIQLSSKVLRSSLGALLEDKVVRISRNRERPAALRGDELFVADENTVPRGFFGYIVFENEYVDAVHGNLETLVVGSELEYLADGDVIRISSDLRRIRVLYRVNAAHNSLLLTERCDHYCLMCSQPPKTRDDSYLVKELRDVLRLASRHSTEIGFTGGEPTLLGDDFLDLVRLAKNYLPESSLHVLSNGRAFEDQDFAKKLGDIDHHDLMIGVPIYSDAPEIHNYVVQSDNALDGTIRGLINLNRYSIRIEIRIVLHRITMTRMVNLAEYIANNLPFVSHVAFMGMEMTGFARANKSLLWVEPDEYAETLKEAVLFLDSRRIRTSVYNLQMCLMPKELWPFMRKSISDWKNEYEPECSQCDVKETCGGFFSSYIHKKPENIRPVKLEGEVISLPAG
jgi:His-Xaa-Ser system radical SAM maturase HxsC